MRNILIIRYTLGKGDRQSATGTSFAFLNTDSNTLGSNRESLNALLGFNRHFLIYFRV